MHLRQAVMKNHHAIQCHDITEVLRVASGLVELYFETVHVLPHAILLEKHAILVLVKVEGLDP